MHEILASHRFCTYAFNSKVGNLYYWSIVSVFLPTSHPDWDWLRSNPLIFEHHILLFQAHCDTDKHYRILYDTLDLDLFSSPLSLLSPVTSRTQQMGREVRWRIEKGKGKETVMTTFLDVEMEHHYAPQNWLIICLVLEGTTNWWRFTHCFYEKEWGNLITVLRADWGWLLNSQILLSIIININTPCL